MNNYSVLGLKKGATIKEIKSKFRELAKIHHPDRGGNQLVFVQINLAYEALLKGDAGEQSTKQNYYQKPKVAEYRFEGIEKDEVGYIVKFYIKRVNRIVIRGENNNKIGTYNVEGKEGIVRLEVLFEAAKKANYIFKVTLLDSEDNSATKTYKVKPPKISFLQKIKNIFK